MRIGIDLGGTKIAGARVSPEGEILKEVREHTGANLGKDHVLGQLRKVIDALMDGACEGVGIGVPGIFEGTILKNLPNVPVLNGVDLKEFAPKIPLVLENDARCFALAEHLWGAGKGASHMIGVTLGTGIGTGIIIGGKAYGGAHGHAGEISHSITDLSLERYREGQGQSDWEALIAGRAIERLYEEASGERMPATDIWQETSPAASQVRERTVRLLSIFCSNIYRIFDPECIVLGGGAASQRLVELVNARMPDFDAPALLRLSALGPKAGVLGAALALNPLAGTPSRAAR